MRHVEPVEPRRLFAALSADPSFAGGKGVALPSGTDQGVLATHGSIYVEGVSTKGVFHVYKYTDAGKLDTAWGDGGSVRPTITRGIHDYYDSFSNPPALTYDPTTGGLLVSTDGGHTVSVERLNAEGRDDAAWASGGVAQFTDKRATFGLNRLVPTAGKKLVLAVTRSSQTDGADDLMLARVGRNGRVDRAFNNGRFATVMAGHSGPTPVHENGKTTRVDSSIPAFGDLQVTDAGYRVIGFRQRTTGTVDYAQVNLDGDFYYTARTNLSVESTAVAADGALADATVTALVHDHVKDAVAATTHYNPIRAFADGDDGVVTLVRQDSVSEIHYGSPVAATVTRIQAGQVTSAKPLGGKIDSVYDFNVFRSAAGLTYVNAGGTFARYTPTLALDAAFGDDGKADTAGPTEQSAADDAGRIVLVQQGKDRTVLNRLV